MWNNTTNFNETDMYEDYIPEQTLFDLVADKVASFLNIYYTPVLVLLGSIGNLVSVFVFYSSKLRFQSTSQYLSALAISDTVFLFQLFPPWLNAVQLNGLFHREGFCQVFVYLSYVSCCLSAWLVVAFTVERFVAVIYPLRRNAICSVTRARHIIFSLTSIALLINIPVLRFAIPSQNDCNIDYEYINYAARFNMVDTAVTFTMPLVAIVILNTWIIIGVYRLESARHQLLKAELPSHRVKSTILLEQTPRSQQKITRMLLIVSSVFVVLNLPAYAMRIITYAYNKVSLYSDRWAALQQVALMFFNTNFGINFILYCLNGQNFRQALRQTLPGVRQQARRAAAVRRVLACRPARASSVSTSIVSNCPETANNGSLAINRHRRHRRATFISKWIFHNSLQRKQQKMQVQQSSDQVEMDVLRTSFHTE